MTRIRKAMAACEGRGGRRVFGTRGGPDLVSSRASWLGGDLQLVGGGWRRVASVWFGSGNCWNSGIVLGIVRVVSRNEACGCQCRPLDYADAAVLRVLALDRWTVSWLIR